MITDFYSFDEYSIPFEIYFLFWSLYMVVFIYAVWKTLLAAPKNKQQVDVSKLFVLCFVAYAVFYCINPDYFNYRKWLKIPYLYDWHKEQAYLYLIMFCRSLPISYSFEVFRLIIWGGAVLLVYHTAKLYRNLLMPGLTMMLLFVFFGDTFCYARASLAMAVFFIGVSLYLCKKNHWSKIFGIGLAICSYLFHYELIVGVLAIPSILFPFEKKKTILFSLFLLAIIIAGLFYINSNLELMDTIFGNEELTDQMEKYNNKEQGVFRMSTFVKYLTLFYPFILINNIFYRYQKLPANIVGIYRITFALFMVTIAFMVVSGLRSTYTYRVMYITIIPMSILITYCYNQGLFKKYQFAVIFLLSILINCIRFFFSM